jgi:ABC-type lipoprotein export system ATPase subunit
MDSEYTFQQYDNGVLMTLKAPNFYLLGAFLSNEFIGVNGGPDGQIYDCPLLDSTDPQCVTYTGRYIMRSLALPTKDWIWRPIAVTLGFTAMWWILAGVVLQFYQIEIGVATIRKQEDHDVLFAGPLQDSQRYDEVTPIEISLQDYTLEVHVKRLTRNSTTKTILQAVTTKFTPGHLNVIMGPSGSGKTSLLQSIACRLHDDAASQYRSEGTITMNNVAVSADVLRSVTSFVTQDDDALMPSLTVRETLQFAARLRLPPRMSRQEKQQKAEDVLLKMGLKDCAQRPIGSNLKKGISGGERRRVSIAIQLLTDPKVLLLDEVSVDFH